MINHTDMTFTNNQEKEVTTMSRFKNTFLKTFIFCITPTFFYLPSVFAAEETKPSVNPNFVYINDGQAVTGWGIQLGDPENWATSVDASRKAKSASGKVSIEPADRVGRGDALQISWSPRKDIKGVFSVYGGPLDLSKFENEGAIVFDMRLDIKPDKNVTFGMDCGYPCRSEMQVSKILKDLRKDEWTTMPIPLNCFTKEGLDIKKVNGPVVISTDGKLKMTIANVRLQKLPEGEKGCAKP
jgi:hypothetical protein